MVFSFYHGTIVDVYVFFFNLFRPKERGFLKKQRHLKPLWSIAVGNFKCFEASVIYVA
jgi:hypothetical protein